MNVTEAIAVLESAIDDPTIGLPQEVFYFLSRITPLVNVDLLIRNSKRQTLLAWRDDPHAGTGWHVPGGILRYKESLLHRVDLVADAEIGARLKVNPVPVQVNQLWKQQSTRGHFVSFLYECLAPDDLLLNQDGRLEGETGFLQWHSICPDNLIVVHERIYRDVICNDAPVAFTGEVPQDYFPGI